MNILIINGSPRKQGNTTKVTEWVEERLKENGANVDTMRVVEYKVEGCKECYYCWKSPDEPGCAVKDDAHDIFDKMLKADLVLYAFPLFCWGPPAQLKALLDRQYCFIKGWETHELYSLVKGKKMAYLVTGGGPVEENIDLVVPTMENTAKFIHQTSQVQHLFVPLCTTPGNMGEDVKNSAYKFADALIGGN